MKLKSRDGTEFHGIHGIQTCKLQQSEVASTVRSGALTFDRRDVVQNFSLLHTQHSEHNPAVKLVYV